MNREMEAFLYQDFIRAAGEAQENMGLIKKERNMPLIKGAKPGSKGFKQNIETEIKIGKPRKQSIAIAYSESRKKKK